MTSPTEGGDLRRWSHRPSDTYILIVASIVGNENRFETEHDSTLEQFPTIASARREGFRTLDRSDDFNIGAVRAGKLAAVLWMDEIVDDEADVVAEIGAEIGL